MRDIPGQGFALPPKLAALNGEMEGVRGEALSALSRLTEEEFSRNVRESGPTARVRPLTTEDADLQDSFPSPVT